MLGVRIPLPRARKAPCSPAHHHGHVPRAGAEKGVCCSEGPVLDRREVGRGGFNRVGLNPFRSMPKGMWSLAPRSALSMVFGVAYMYSSIM